MNGMSTTIYVALLGEGTDVWRPVQADRVDCQRYQIVGTVPEGESWEFEPGSIVRCKETHFSDGAHGLVAYEKVCTTRLERQ